MAQQMQDLPEDLRGVLEEAVRRILEIASPRAIILFGSWAEGRSGEDSDVDILVVADADRPFQLAAALAEPVRAAVARRPVDVVVITPAQWDQLQHIPGQVVHEAAHYGVRLYEAA